MNTLGLLCGIVTFLSVWLGHVSVRYIEARSASIRLPVSLFALAGLGLAAGSLLASSRALSAALGILAVTVLWDAFEFVRQQRRVMKGHAPANPHNPRHRRILAEHLQANSVAWLKREPRGRPFTPAELEAIRKASQ